MIPVSLTPAILVYRRAVMNLTVSSSTTDYNAKSAAIAAGWNQIDPLDLTVTINSSVIVSASGTGTYALDTGSGFPAGTTIKLINNGYIVGRGGDGGAGGGTAGFPNNGQAGGNGGPALRAQYPISVTNNSVIGSGGGGGGGGGLSLVGTYQDPSPGAGGGGGASYGAGGANGGGAAGLTTGGTSLGSGTGGGLGSSGAAGLNGNNGAGGAGGAPGAAVVGNSNITWVATGTRYGALT